MEKCDLSNIEINRYSRQLVLPNFATQGQIALRNARVLIVGCGGLGCPAAIFLAAAGVGTLGVVDHDTVDISNLHRQILHKEDRVEVAKVLSLAYECERLNSLLKINAYHLQLNCSNALQIVEKYDVVLDCTDNLATRYLVNDACVLAGRPLVSGSALRFEGQLTVYHLAGGPCYRCVFPRPVPAALVTNCSDGGVIGAVPGTIGTLQALEAVKILTGVGATYAGKLLLFDGESGDFMNLKLQPRNKDCAICGDAPTIRELVDYVQFCGASPDDKDKGISVLGASDRLTVQELKRLRDESAPHVLIDVRPEHEFVICRIKGSVNVPLARVSMEAVRAVTSAHGDEPQVVMVCRQGNDSQLAVKKLLDEAKDSGLVVKDLIGGLNQWSRAIDPTFPVY